MPSFRVLVFTLVLLLLLLLYGDAGEGQWQQEPHSALECPDQDLPFLADFTCVSNDSVNFTQISIKTQPRYVTNRPLILLSMDQSQLLLVLFANNLNLNLKLAVIINSLYPKWCKRDRQASKPAYECFVWGVLGLKRSFWTVSMTSSHLGTRQPLPTDYEPFSVIYWSLPPIHA